MKLELSSVDAKSLELGHRWKLITRLKIVQIADRLIENSDSVPSAEVCELANCLHDHQVKNLLSQFFDNVDKWKPVCNLLTKYIKLSELNSSENLVLFYAISNYADWDDPEPWREIKILCHELRDARVGVYGDEVEIATEIHSILMSAIQN